MRRILMALLVLVTLTSLKPNHLTTIFVIGDSTAAKKDLYGLTGKRVGDGITELF